MMRRRGGAIVGAVTEPAHRTTLLRRAIVGQMRRRTMSAMGVAKGRQEERAMWAAGDYDAIARPMFWDVGERVVRAARVGAGDRVLDVACGTGNAAVRAAGAGADVVGVDLTPELFAAGRRNAAEAGVAVDWVEGDAEALPFADGRFDVVLSVFGCMFAPQHEVTARELVRVLAPGGRLAVCAWTPQSAMAELMRSLMRELPPAPGEGPPPPLWGDEDHVRGLFAGSGLELAFTREDAEFRHPSIDAALDLYARAWGPFIQVRERLEPEGRWPEFRAELAAVLERRGTTGTDGYAYAGEYLLVTGRRG